MRYLSTKGSVEAVGFREAVFRGLPADNGLYVPEEVPSLPARFFKALPHMDFRDIAFEVARYFVDEEIPSEQLELIVEDAFNFPVALHRLEDRQHVLELFHGPTLAFKDFGARFMARVMACFQNESSDRITILVATSGDTGSAVAQGFLAVPGIDVVLLYPGGKVSAIQEKQLTTIGRNVRALEVDGTFDDCQRLVKAAFLDPELSKKRQLSSANSINIARWLPQAFYYFYAAGRLAPGGEKLCFSVPSGNYGNLCGGLLARKMGLNARFMAASNANDVVPEYLNTGKFRPRSSVRTMSNAMDVGNPSNFPRMLSLYGNNYGELKADLEGCTVSEEQTVAVLRSVFQHSDYVMCPHTAVGYAGLQAMAADHPESEVVCLATAHPAKFSEELRDVLPVQVPMPERLAEVLNRNKEAIPMSARFEDFRDYLLGLD